MLYAAQLRAARVLLGWRQEELAKAANIGLSTIQKIEQTGGLVMGNVSTVMRLQQALENAGIKFLDTDSNGGPGVRWMSTPKNDGTRPG